LDTVYRVLFEEIDPSEELDYEALLTRIHNSQADIIFFFGHHVTASEFVQEVRAESDLQVEILCSHGVRDNEFIVNGGEDTNGVYVAALRDSTENFLAQIAANEHIIEYGVEHGLFYLNAYSAMLMLIEAIEISDSTDPATIRKALLANEVDTPLGKLSFSSTGDAIGVGYEIYKVVDEDFVRWPSEGDSAVTPVSSFDYKKINENEIAITEFTGFETEVWIPDTIEGKPVTSIGDDAFRDCTSLTSIIIPDGVTSIGDFVFYKCTNLTSITIGESVTSIGRSTFKSCTNLTSITIPDSVTSIGIEAFQDCTSLTSITIPDSVTSIGIWAFEECWNLTDIYCEAISEPAGWESTWDAECDAAVHWGDLGAGGDPGPAGGIIFYDDEADGVDDIVGYRYLEAAPYGWFNGEEDPDIVWGGYGTLVDGTELGVGSGKTNTEKIVAKYGDAEPYENRFEYAAKICSDLVFGGYDDWFLPSKDELNLIYLNLSKEGLGGFTSFDYWSSSEANADIAWEQDFNYGDQSNDHKYTTTKVRAVRAYN
jgi:hypothetical protein